MTEYTATDYFFIPLVDIKIDMATLTNEVYKYINPTADDYGITCRQEDVNNDNYNFKKYSGMRPPAPVKDNPLHASYENGAVDTDIIYWPKILQGSYIQQLGNSLSDLIGLSNPRCRLSLFNEHRIHDSSLEFHYDKHTPVRIHIALETTSDCLWLYKEKFDSPTLSLHHPVMDNPVLVSTGSFRHNVYIPAGHKRMHLWYQYHSSPDVDLIHSLIEKYKSTK
jgi:hypothetical protein